MKNEDLLFYYQLYKLGTGGHTQKVMIYKAYMRCLPKAKGPKKKQPNKLRWNDKFAALKKMPINYIPIYQKLEDTSRIYSMMVESRDERG